MSKLKKDNESYYKVLDFFMMRNPVLSFDSYKELFCKDISKEDLIEKLIEVSNDPVIKEAILVSSTSLNNAIERLNKEKNLDKKNQIISSMVKYIIRMTSRTTPYGLFSGVTLGEFSDKTNLKINNVKNHKKRARPDMEWLYGIMNEIEKNKDILKSLKVKVNTLSIDNGIRLDMPYISNYGQIRRDSENSSLSASIRFTPPVKFVMSEAQELTDYNTIFDKVSKANPYIDKKTIEKFLNQLLENEYLITEIRTPLINKDPFTYVIDKIKDIKEGHDIYEKLINIKNLIDKYNSLPIGQGIDTYKELVKSMKEMFECDNYLQVDLAIDKDTVTLSSNVKEEVKDLIEFLLRLSSNDGEPSHISSYKMDFMEFYGQDREVSVLELLDEDKGIGAPAGYMNPYSLKERKNTPPSDNDAMFLKSIIRKIQQCILNNEDEVILTKDDIKPMGGRELSEIPFSKMPKSLDYYAFLKSESPEEVDKGNFSMFISPNPGVNGAGRTFGRFVDILPKEVYKYMEEIHDEEKKIFKDDYIIAEITELPQSGRTSNVTLNWNAKEYELAIADNYSDEKKKIDIKDIYIGIDSYTDRFYIKSKTLNKRIIAASSHMLNILSGSNIYRFLREISQYYEIEVFERIYVRALDKFGYVPRIKYNKTVLIPATFRVSLKDLNLNKKSSLDEFKKSIDKWIKDFKVPQYVYEKDADNRLLLNLKNQLHLEELFNILKSKDKEDVVLNEVEDNIENHLLKNEDKGYFSEFVFPLVLNKDKYKVIKENKEDMLNTNYDYSINQRKEKTYSDIRQKFFGDEWIYLKLYGNSKRTEEFLGFELLDFCLNLKEKDLIDKFFFIRYRDSESHIRLRFKCSKIDENLINILNDWFKHLREEGLLTKVVFDTYFRETERYGGEEIIELGEELFFRDSILILNLIKLKRMGVLNLEKKHIAMCNIVNMLENLGIDYENQKQIFENRFDKDKYRDEFKKDRKILMNLTNSMNDWENLRKTKEGQMLYDLFSVTKEALKNYGEKMFSLDKEEKLWNSKGNIVFSLTHMFCNRFIGDNNIEREIMHLTRHSLHAIEYMRKNNKNHEENK